MAPLLTTRGHAYKLYKKRSSVTVRCEFFSERVVNTWNNLPNGVDFYRASICEGGLGSRNSDRPSVRPSVTTVDCDKTK